MLPPPEVATFVGWFAGFQREVVGLVRSVLNTGSAPAPGDPSPTAETIDARTVGGAIEIEWGQWLDASAHPELERMRQSIRRSRAQIELEHPIPALAEQLRDAIAALPDTVMLHEPATAAREPSEPAPDLEVPLRPWFEAEFAAGAMPAFAQLEHTLIEALNDIDQRIAEVERVLDYYTLGVQRHAAEFQPAEAEDFARVGLTRVRSLIDDLHHQCAAWARRALTEFAEHTAVTLETATAPFRAHDPDAIRDGLAAHARLAEGGVGHQGQRWRRIQRAYHRAIPYTRQLVSTLRSLALEPQPRPLAPDLRSLLDSDPAHLGSALPLSYRRLFTVAPVEMTNIYTRRPAVEKVCSRAIEDWRLGVPHTIVIHGDRGAGKRTLTNYVLAGMHSQASLGVHWVRLGEDLRDEPAVAGVLGRLFGSSDEIRSFAELRRPPPAPARRRVIVIENAERLLPPSSAGIRRMNEFLALVAETAATTLWILLMATPAAMLALHRLGFGKRIPTVVHVEAMTDAELRAMISARHRISGFEIEYDEPHVPLLDRLAHPRASLRGRAHSDVFYSRLGLLTGGNPRQALYYWLAHARPHSQVEGRIVVAPLPAARLEFLPTLPLSQRLILALLAQHGSLASAELATILSAPQASVEGELMVLRTAGYLAPTAQPNQHWTLRSTIAHPLVMELRSINMI